MSLLLQFLDVFGFLLRQGIGEAAVHTELVGPFSGWGVPRSPERI